VFNGAKEIELKDPLGKYKAQMVKEGFENQ
jgi:hypothetical protein